jgi:peptidoglycan hydrolase CwlO-like protein
MKKIAVMLLAAFSLAAAAPVFAAEMTKEQKDQCLLASKSCATEVDSIQKKVKKLNTEIKKGTKVYTPEELKKLNDKLKETNKFLDEMLANP